MSLTFSPITADETVGSPLFAGNHQACQRWRDEMMLRLDGEDREHPGYHKLSAVITEVTGEQLKALCGEVGQQGFACYEWTQDLPGASEHSASVVDLLRTLGLTQGDQGVISDASGLSLLEDKSGSPQGRFPPYQSKAMNWHTDGYYNAMSQTVRCFTLHCIEPAASGGELLLMDNDVFVLALLEDNPDLLNLLSHPAAMTLPENQDSEGHNRPDRTVPVLKRSDDGSFCVRFTTRTQHIRWRNTETEAAAQRAAELIEKHKDWQHRIKLQRGQGIITRNILHARTAFTDVKGQPKRQILRGRFMQLPQPSVGRKNRQD